MLGVLTKKRSIKYIITLAATVVLTMFIFGNSFAGYDASHSVSDSISDMILPDKYSHSETVLLFIRKAAHLVEYAALGIAVMLFFKCVETDYGKRLYGVALFYVLSVAVFDEHIQSFSDRTSSTGDILLDFLGALIGIFTVLSIRFIYTKIKKRKEKSVLV